MDTAPKLQPAMRTHLAVLCLIVLISALAALRPEWLLHLPIRGALPVFFGIKCPFCGMTHDFVSIWHRSRPIKNPGSFAAAIFIYVVYPALVIRAWIARRQEVFQNPILRRTIFAAIAVLWVANNLTK